MKSPCQRSVGGVVQVPGVQRNATGVKAINAADLALRGGGRHIVSLDAAIGACAGAARACAPSVREIRLAGPATIAGEVLAATRIES